MEYTRWRLAGFWSSRLALRPEDPPKLMSLAVALAQRRPSAIFWRSKPRLQPAAEAFGDRGKRIAHELAQRHRRRA